jgi:hypothetical protein
MVRIFPSQPKRKLSEALKTVGVLSGRLEPSKPLSWLSLLAPFVLRSWHEAQLRELPRDRRGSANRRSPSLTFEASIGRGSGTGVMGSSETFASCHCTSGCGIAEESNRPPGIKMQIIAIRRQ